MKIKFTKLPTTTGTIKVSLDGGQSFTDYNIADIHESGITLSDDQDYDKIQIQAPANVLKNLNVISRIIIDDSQAEQEPPRIEYCVSKSSSCSCGSLLNFSITKGRALFDALQKSSYAEFVCPEWFHLDGDYVTIDGREYDYGDYEGPTEYTYVSPDSDGIQYAPDRYEEGLSDDEEEERYAEYDSFMSNWQTAYDMTNKEIVSRLSSATIGFRIEGMWVPMIFI